MARYLIEFRHTSEECVQALDEIDARASDLLNGIYWGCVKGKDTGWTIVEAESESEALRMVASALRDRVSITEVREFTVELIEWLHGKTA